MTRMRCAAAHRACSGGFQSRAPIAPGGHENETGYNFRSGNSHYLRAVTLDIRLLFSYAVPCALDETGCAETGSDGTSIGKRCTET